MKDIVFLIKVTDSELEDRDAQEIQDQLERLVRTAHITKGVSFTNTESDRKFNELLIIEDKTIPELRQIRRSSGTR